MKYPTTMLLALLPVLVLVVLQHGLYSCEASGFVQTSGTHFVMNGKPLYLINGFNAYWLMYMASDPSNRVKVTTTFQEASKYGMNVARTWAFSDGGSNKPLQLSPGFYNEEMFKGLDFVISEAKKNGVFLILSLVNNWDDFGGKKQYNQWARDHGQYIGNDDDFFTNSVVRDFFKNHIKTVLTRVNTVTGVAYKDDPTIFAWELMNEPRCQSDLSGKSLQSWVTEMSAHVKSIDRNHLLEVGLEGFYGETMPENKQFNPGYQVGTDFVANNQLSTVDFATIHLYPDQWVPSSNEETQTAFVDKWVHSHIDVSNSVLKKPIMITEFGKSSRSSGYSVEARNKYFNHLYDMIYTCAANKGPCGGGTFWQLMTQGMHGRSYAWASVPPVRKISGFVPEGMDGWKDGYEVVLAENPSTANAIAAQSHKLSVLSS